MNKGSYKSDKYHPCVKAFDRQVNNQTIISNPILKGRNKYYQNLEPQSYF